jgi:hypothetical protein
MKRVLVLLLAVLYLVSGVGLTLRAHYCMGKLTGAAIERPTQHSDTHRCSRCGMEKKRSNGCCKDEIKTLKSAPDQTLVKSFSLQAPVLAADIQTVHPQYADLSVSYTTAIPSAPAHGPPLRSGVPLYLRVRCLRL